MALGTEKFEYTVIGKYEDHISGAIKQTPAQVDGVKQSFEKLNGTFEKVFKYGLAFLGLHEGVRFFRSLHNELMNFAKEHETAAAVAVKHFEDGYNHLFTKLVESDTFKNLITFFGDAFDFAAVLLNGKQTWESFLAWLGMGWDYLLAKTKSDWNNVFRIMWLSAKSLVTGDIESVQKAIVEGFVPSDEMIMAQMNLDNARLKMEKDFQKERKTLRTSATKEEADKAKEEAKKMKEDLAAINAIALKQQFGIPDGKKDWEAHQKKLENQKYFANEEAKAWMDSYNKELDAKIKNIDIEEQMDEEDRERKIRNMDMLQETFGNLSTFMQSKNRAMFEVGKASALGEAIMNTYAGANKALAQGGFFGIAMAASVIAVGLANVAKIASTHFGGGGSGGAASAPSSGTGSEQRNFNGQNQTSQNNAPVITINPTVYSLSGKDLTTQGIWTDVVNQIYMEMQKKNTLQTQPIFGRP
jgi:hypothetical protein